MHARAGMNTFRHLNEFQMNNYLEAKGNLMERIHPWSVFIISWIHQLKKKTKKLIKRQHKKIWQIRCANQNNSFLTCFYFYYDR